MPHETVTLRVRVWLPLLWLGQLTAWVAAFAIAPFFEEDEVEDLGERIGLAVCRFGFIKCGREPWRRFRTTADDLDGGWWRRDSFR